MYMCTIVPVAAAGVAVACAASADATEWRRSTECVRIKQGHVHVGEGGVRTEGSLKHSCTDTGIDIGAIVGWRLHSIQQVVSKGKGGDQRGSKFAWL